MMGLAKFLTEGATRRSDYMTLRFTTDLLLTLLLGYDLETSENTFTTVRSILKFGTW